MDRATAPSVIVRPVETLFQLYIVCSVPAEKTYTLNVCTHQCTSASYHAIMSEVFFFRVLLQVGIARHKAQAEWWWARHSQQSVWELLTAVCDAHSILLRQFWDHGARVNTYCYCTALPHLREAIQLKQSLSLKFFCTGLEYMCDQYICLKNWWLYKDTWHLLLLVLLDILWWYLVNTPCILHWDKNIF